MATFHPTIMVPIESLEDHELNSNIVPEAVLKKLERNIKRSKWYPPLIVRQLKGEPPRKLIDGHHRRRILRDLGYTEVEIKPVTCSDREELVLLASLNTLHGTEDPRKRAALIHELSGTIRVEELALILPEDENQVRDMLALLSTDFIALEESIRTGAGDGEEGPKAKVFLLYPDQMEIVNKAIGAVIAEEGMARNKNPDGQALELLCADWLAGNTTPAEEPE
jgi:hypothetical protein